MIKTEFDGYIQAGEFKAYIFPDYPLQVAYERNDYGYPQIYSIQNESKTEYIQFVPEWMEVELIRACEKHCRLKFDDEVNLWEMRPELLTITKG